MQCMSVQTAVCKSVQSIGLSPRKEHQIENALAIQLRSSGPEFVLSRLSDLSDWRKMHMKGDTQYHPKWHRYKIRQGKSIPSDPIGANLWSLSDKAFFATLGAIRTSIEFGQPTEKQLGKWVDGIRCERVSSEEKTLPFRCNQKLCETLEQSLQRRWEKINWFSPEDLTGTSIPGSGKEIMLRRTDKVHPSAESLVSAYGFTVSTAPLFVWQFMKDIDLPSLVSHKYEGVSIKLHDELQSSLNELIDSKLSSSLLMDEAEQGSSFLSDEEYLRSLKFRNNEFGFQHTVGNIGLLQQKSGKLRTVANPNRLVQYCSVPLGEELAKLVDFHKESAVRSEEDGILWAQQKLRDGVELSSFDMSSATDRLDYKKFLHEYFSEVYNEPERYPLLLRNLEYFEDVSSCNWSVPGYVQDLLDMPSNEIGWTVGQPLGLRPSFPTLSLMNIKIAQMAVLNVDGAYTPGHFMVRGDDIIIESRYADEYMKGILSFNGKINNDKSLVSDRYAEFCSQLITRSSHFPLKPKFLSGIEGSFENIQKFSTKGLSPVVPKWVKETYCSISKFHLNGFNTIKYSRSSEVRPLSERVAVNTLISVIKPALRDTEKVSLQTLYMRAVEERKQGKKSRPASLATGTISSPYGDLRWNPVTRHYELLDEPELDLLGTVSSDSSTSVEVPVKKEWDYRENRYSQPSSSVTSAKKLAKTLSSVDIVNIGPLTEASITQKGVTTSVLVDMSDEKPEVSVRESKQIDGQVIASPSRELPSSAQRELDRAMRAIERNQKRELSDDLEL